MATFAFFRSPSLQLSLSTYRLLLHPLRKYPGPFLAKLSDVYGGYFAVARRLHLQTYRDHLQYSTAYQFTVCLNACPLINRQGSVVRHGPNRLLFNSPTALKDIYQNERVIKPSIYRASEVRPGQYNVFNSRDKKIHSAKRRLVGQALSDHSLRQFEPTLLEQISAFVGILLEASETSHAVNMTPSCRHLGLDTIGQLGFGYDLKMQSEEEHRFLKKAIVFTNFRINLSLQLPALINFRPDLIASHLPNSIRKRLLAVVEKMIATRLAQPVDAKHDLLSFITPKLQTDLKGIQNGELWPEAVFFFGAGGDTTATAMAGAFFYLSRNPDCYKQLATEIRTTFKRITSYGFTSWHYALARVGLSGRWTGSSGSRWTYHTTLTLVGVNIYSRNHNDGYFPDPFVFRPERWLCDDADKARAASTPFSVGSRTCAGKPLAYQEISLALAKTLWYLYFEPVPGDLSKVGGGLLGELMGEEERANIRLMTSLEHTMMDLIWSSIHDKCIATN
ncbi:hypothetical protein SCARD494_12656 [Seiridium cardinale]